MRIDVITLFPELIEQFARVGIVGRAFSNGSAELHCWDLRRFAEDRYGHVDDAPYGGGAGMVLQPRPIFRAFHALKDVAGTDFHAVFPTPQGKLFRQEDAERLSKIPHLVFLCGRYKAVDERVRERWIDEELSIGDYVLSGGELATMVILDAVIRLLPGAVNDPESTAGDTFPTGLLDAPYYTRPAEIEGLKVPEILLSGDHQAIAAWRHEQRLQRTRERRPDLYQKYMLELEEHHHGQS